MQRADRGAPREINKIPSAPQANADHPLLAVAAYTHDLAQQLPPQYIVLSLQGSSAPVVAAAGATAGREAGGIHNRLPRGAAQPNFGKRSSAQRSVDT